MHSCWSFTYYALFYLGPVLCSLPGGVTEEATAVAS